MHLDIFKIFSYQQGNMLPTLFEAIFLWSLSLILFTIVSVPRQADLADIPQRCIYCFKDKLYIAPITYLVLGSISVVSSVTLSLCSCNRLCSSSS